MSLRPDLIQLPKNPSGGIKQYIKLLQYFQGGVNKATKSSFYQLAHFHTLSSFIHYPHYALIPFVRVIYTPHSYASFSYMKTSIQAKAKFTLAEILYYVLHLIILARVHTVIALTFEELRTWTKLFPFYSSKFRLVHTAIPLPDSDARSCMKSFESKKFIILFVGSLDSRKDPLLLLKTLEKLNQSIPSARTCVEAWICGDGILSKSLKTYASNNSMDNVVFYGSISNNAVQLLMKKASILFSVSHQEGLPITFLEAICHRLPIVAYAYKGGSYESYFNPLSTIMFYSRDPSLISSILSKLINSPHTLAAMASSSRSLTKYKEFIDQHSSIYSLPLNSRHD